MDRSWRGDSEYDATAKLASLSLILRPHLVGRASSNQLYSDLQLCEDVNLGLFSGNNHSSFKFYFYSPQSVRTWLNKIPSGQGNRALDICQKRSCSAVSDVSRKSPKAIKGDIGSSMGTGILHVSQVKGILERRREACWTFCVLYSVNYTQSSF